MHRRGRQRRGLPLSVRVPGSTHVAGIRPTSDGKPGLALRGCKAAQIQEKAIDSFVTSRRATLIPPIMPCVRVQLVGPPREPS
jgi:hypothetical protein